MNAWIDAHIPESVQVFVGFFLGAYVFFKIEEYFRNLKVGDAVTPKTGECAQELCFVVRRHWLFFWRIRVLTYEHSWHGREESWFNQWELRKVHNEKDNYVRR